MRQPSARPLSFRAVRQPDGTYRWRLLAPNGRTLGLSAESFEDAETSWQRLLETASWAARLLPSYRHPGADVGWIWSANLPDGRLVAVGARSYERRATCVFGFQRFIGVLGDLTEV